MPHRPLSLWILAALLCGVALPANLLAQRPRRDIEGITVEKDVTYSQVGEGKLHLDVIRPKEKASGLRPVLVWIHGGGWRSGNKAQGTSRLAPFIASGDYVGFSVQYRLSGEATWPAQIHDCKAAIRWIRAHAREYGGDPDRIGIWGSSAGGHLVSLLGTSGGVAELAGDGGTPDVSSRVSCVVDYCGPSDFLSFKMGERPNSPVALLFGGLISEKKQEAAAASPVTHVSPDDPPFLIVHGTKDPVVPIEQAELLHARLEKAGVDSTFVRITGGGHGIGGAEVTERVRSFFGKHLLGKDLEVSGEAIDAAGRPRAKKAQKQ